MDFSAKSTIIIQDQNQNRGTFRPTPRTKTKTLRDMRWEEHKDEIEHLYIKQNKPLNETMLVMQNRYGFRPSARAWKTKLRTWRFDKYLPAKDMKILSTIREKRLREEGKETVFFHGSSTIAAERFENFKKRKVSSKQEDSPPSIGTPENVTYCTPKPEDVTPPDQDHEPSKNNISKNEEDESTIDLPIEYLSLPDVAVGKNEAEESTPTTPTFSSLTTSQKYKKSVDIIPDEKTPVGEHLDSIYQRVGEDCLYAGHIFSSLFTTSGEEEMPEEVFAPIINAWSHKLSFTADDIPTISNARSHKSGTTISGSTLSHKYGLTYSDGSNMSVMDFNYSALFL